MPNTVLSDFPSAVAVMTTRPGAIAVTAPSRPTVAFVPSLVVQVIGFGRTIPLAARADALSGTRSPTTVHTESGERTTDATGSGSTRTTATPTLPSLVAEMMTRPAAFAVTLPLVDTDTMPPLAVLQTTCRPNSWVPLRSRTVAASCWLEPGSREMESGRISTEAAGTGPVLSLPSHAAASATIAAMTAGAEIRR